MKKALVLTALAALASTAHAQLWIDFNSTTQGGGPTNEAGYQAYNAGHEAGPDFDTKSYSAFGTTVTLTPTWPNTTDTRVQQMIDRGAGNDANWEGTNIDLLTDWIGIDTRTSNGGNGNWDGTTGTPTYLNLTFGGLPAGSYSYASFHHDTENVWAGYTVEVSVDGGGFFSAPVTGQMTSSSPNGNPDNPNDTTTGTPETLSSTFNTVFDANGTDDVVLRYAALSDTAVHRQLFAINGLQVAVIPEPGTALLSLVGLTLLFRRRR